MRVFYPGTASPRQAKVKHRSPRRWFKDRYGMPGVSLILLLVLFLLVVMPWAVGACVLVTALLNFFLP